MELYFTDGCRFFSSGHSKYQGVHMVDDENVYGPRSDRDVVSVIQVQERAAMVWQY